MKISTSTQNVDSFIIDKPNVDPSIFEKKKDNDQPNLETEKVNKEEVKQSVEKLNKTARAFNKRFHFSVHEGTKRVMVQVIDTVTDQVINEIPPKKVLDIIASMNELLGLVVDKKV